MFCRPINCVAPVVKKLKQVSSYIVQYPILRAVQSAFTLYFLANLFNQTPSQLLWEASSRLLQLMHEDCTYTYPPLSIARYSLIQLGELEQCRVEKLAHGYNTVAQDILVPVYLNSTSNLAVNRN